MTLPKVTHLLLLFLKDLTSEIIESILIKFHMQQSNNGMNENLYVGPGHMTKMATMAMHDKNIKKSNGMIAYKLDV